MTSRLGLVICLCASLGCSDGGSAPSSGPIVDNTQWVPSSEGEAIFGPQPEGSGCEPTPIDCEDYYPWPPGECVEFQANASCIAAYIPECFPPSYTVLAIYTRMPDDGISLCDWLTLEQPSLQAIRAGDVIEVRAYHNELTAPVPGEARMSFAVGDQLAFDETILIPNASEFLTGT
ncbi:MAG TPA: hypothetical protein VFG22_13295 [Polyangiales bacterium]|nr:hypothetical protein [Polyangiales bacterium]